jgi:cyclic pyranopterin monophosphate synthase
MPLPTPKRTERRRLSHLDRSGRPRMVDVSAKPVSARHATAEAEVAMAQETISLVVDGGGTKGDVLTVAELAGVMGGKRTSDLVPLCHPIPLTDLAVEVRPDRARGALVIRATAATVAQTGVEMEALTAASVAALTVYDMIKGVDRGAEIRHLRVVEKSGGRSGTWRRPTEGSEETATAPRAARGTRGPRRRG